MDFRNISNYDLGILWSIGSQIEDRFVLRHRNRYFLDRIQKYCHNTVYEQAYVADGRIQYVLKISNPDMQYLYDIGWTNRNTEIRNIPKLNSYNDFLRSYIELHSRLDYSTRHNMRNGKKIKALRLRIYGNYGLIDGINNILCSCAGAKIKKIEKIHNDKTAVVSYQSEKEINMIYDYIFDSPFFKPYWDDVDFKLQYPKIE